MADAAPLLICAQFLVENVHVSWTKESVPQVMNVAVGVAWLVNVPVLPRMRIAPPEISAAQGYAAMMEPVLGRMEPCSINVGVVANNTAQCRIEYMLTNSESCITCLAPSIIYYGSGLSIVPSSGSNSL